MSNSWLDPDFVLEFVKWHERRMEDLKYPPEIREELRRYRHKFIPKINRDISKQTIS